MTESEAFKEWEKQIERYVDEVICWAISESFKRTGAMKQGSLVKFHLGPFKGLVARISQYDDAPMGDPKIRVKFAQYDYEAEMPRSDLQAHASEIKTEK